MAEKIGVTAPSQATSKAGQAFELCSAEGFDWVLKANGGVWVLFEGAVCVETAGEKPQK